MRQMQNIVVCTVRCQSMTKDEEYYWKEPRVRTLEEIVKLS